PAARGRAGADGRPRAPAPRRARRRPQAAREGGPQGAGAPAARRGGHGAARRARHGRGHGPGRPHRRDEPRRAARQRDAGRGQARPGRDRGLPRTGGRMSADVETRVRAAAAADGPAPAGRPAAAGAEGAPTAQAAPAADGRPPLLAVERLSVRYGGVQALSEVDLSVGHGQLVTVIGANGARKSSLVNAIVGVVPKAGGRVLLDGEDGTQATPEAPGGRARPRAPRALRRADRRGQPAPGRLPPLPEGRPRHQGVAGRGLRHLPAAREPATPARRDDVRRRAADAGDRPRDDGPPPPAPARRAEPGTGAPDRRGDLPGRGRAARRRRHGAADRAERPRRPAPGRPRLPARDGERAPLGARGGAGARREGGVGLPGGLGAGSPLRPACVARTPARRAGRPLALTHRLYPVGEDRNPLRARRWREESWVLYARS